METTGPVQAVKVQPDTHARILALAARWRATPTISIIPITHDRLMAMALPMLEAAIPWAELESEERIFAALSKVVAMLPATKKEAA